MAGVSPVRSRSRSRLRVDEEDSEWDDKMQQLFDTLREHTEEECEDVIGNTVKLLRSKGIRVVSQLRSCPKEVLTHYLPPSTHGQELVLVHCLLSALAEKDKQVDPTAKAMRLVAREQRAQRKRRNGQNASSSEDEEGGKAVFNCAASLKKYGLVFL